MQINSFDNKYKFNLWSKVLLNCSLEYYRAFYYSARLSSISKAAEALFLTQPAVTRSIQKLEEYLDCRLFIRGAKGVRLTKEGEHLFQKVADAFTSMIDGEKQLRQMALFEMGTLEIGATETALYYFLLPKIEAFRVRYPKINIHIAGSFTKDMVHLLQEDRADISFAETPIDELNGQSDILLEPILEFHDIFAAGPNFSQLKNLRMTAEELSRLPLVTAERGTSVRSNIDRWFESQGVLFDPVYSVHTNSSVAAFVLHNLAVGVMPVMFAKEVLKRKGCFALKTEIPISARSIVLMYKKTVPMSGLCRLFVEFLLEGQTSFLTNLSNTIDINC